MKNIQGKIAGLAFAGLSGLVGLTSCVSSRSVELQLYDVSSQIEDAAIALKTKGVQQGLPLQNIYRSFDFNKNGTIDESESDIMASLAGMITLADRLEAERYGKEKFNEGYRSAMKETEEMVHCIREMVEKLNEELSNKQ